MKGSDTPSSFGWDYTLSVIKFGKHGIFKNHSTNMVLRDCGFIGISGWGCLTWHCVDYFGMKNTIKKSRDAYFQVDEVLAAAEAPTRGRSATPKSKSLCLSRTPTPIPQEGQRKALWCENCNSRLVELKKQAVKLWMPHVSRRNTHPYKVSVTLFFLKVLELHQTNFEFWRIRKELWDTMHDANPNHSWYCTYSECL